MRLSTAVPHELCMIDPGSQTGLLLDCIVFIRGDHGESVMWIWHRGINTSKQEVALGAQAKHETPCLLVKCRSQTGRESRPDRSVIERVVVYSLQLHLLARTKTKFVERRTKLETFLQM